MGFTGPSTQDMADETVIKNAEKGTTNEPKIMSLNFTWKTVVLQKATKKREDWRLVIRYWGRRVPFVFLVAFCKIG